MANILNMACSIANSEALARAVNFCNYMSQGILILYSARDLKNSLQDQEMSAWQKTHRVATDFFTLICQITSLSITFKEKSCEIPKDIKITVHAAAGAANVAKAISQKSIMREGMKLTDYVEISLTAGIEFANVSKSMGFDVKNLEVALQAAAAGNKVIIHRNEILSAVRAIQRLLARFGQISQLVDPLENPDSARRESERVQTIGDLGLNESYLQDVAAVHRARTIEDFELIPQLFVNDRVLITWLCPISKRAIRYIVVVVDSTRESENSVFYEHSAIMDWIENHPEELPPNWPEAVEYTAVHLDRDEEKQSEIDARLQELLEGLRSVNEARPIANDLNFSQRNTRS